MKGRLTILGAVALLAAAVAGVALSSATFTTTSETQIAASADDATGWLHVFGQANDPDEDTGYATQRVRIPPGPLAAAGQDFGLAVDLGSFPDKNQTFAFSRVFALKTPATFPDPAVTQVTVTVTLVADGTDQPLTSPGLQPFAGGRSATTVTMGPGAKFQFNVSVKARKRFQIGTTYTPHVLVALSWAGGPTGYYVYDVPVAVTDAGF